MTIELINKDEVLDDNINSFSIFDAETALIGCILWDNRNFEKIADFISEEHFVDKNNSIIFKTRIYCLKKVHFFL